MAVRLSNTRKAYSRIKVIVLTGFHCNKNDDNDDNKRHSRVNEGNDSNDDNDKTQKNNHKD